MDTIFKGISPFVIVLGVSLVSLPIHAEEVLQTTESENVEGAVAEDLAPEGMIEEEVPLLQQEGEEGEITERGVPRIKMKPRPRINIQEKSRPRINIPQNPRKQITPPQKFRLTPQGGGGGNKQPIYIPNQVIVKLRPGMSLPSSVMKKFGLQKLQTTSGGGILFRFAIPPGLEKFRNPLTVAQELAKHAAVIFAEPLTIRTPDKVPNDTFFKDHQWNYFENGTGQKQSPGGIGLPKAWETTTGSRNVVVAVIDTGIVGHDKKRGPVHPDIELEIIELKNILPGFDFITDPVSANDGDGRDADPTDAGDARELKDLADCKFLLPLGEDTWHGTSMASIIGVGRTNNSEGIAGVNWEVSILPIRVSGKCGVHPADEIDAIRWAAGIEVPGAPVNQNPARIINYSMGGTGPCTRLLQEAIDDVVLKKGVSFVVSAGNNTTLAAFHTPSNCKNVISVAASDERGHLASYSNFGPAVTIMAPGGNFLLDVPKKDNKLDQVLTLFHPAQRDPKINDQDPKFKTILPKIKDIPVGYAFGKGSSNAAPHVSGVLALWLAEDFSLTHAELLKGLKDSALKRNPAQCPNSCGAGLLNADLSSLIIPGKAVPPPPLKKGPPPKEPPPVAQCTIKTTDIVHSLKIDIGNNDSQTTSAKQALFRMLIHGDVEARRDASGMIKATENGTLAGIFQRNKGPVAARGQRMTPQKGWWELIPQGQLGMCLKEPVGETPMIIYREQEMSTSQLDTTLRNAWRQCGLPALPFPCVYQKDLGNKPSQTKACLDKAEEVFLQGEQQCDAQFVNNKACQNAFNKCLGETGGQVASCEQRVPCILHPARNQFNACMNQVNKDRDQAKALCE